jgi:hypothetical protein
VASEKGKRAVPTFLGVSFFWRGPYRYHAVFADWSVSGARQSENVKKMGIKCVETPQRLSGESIQYKKKEGRAWRTHAEVASRGGLV